MNEVAEALIALSLYLMLGTVALLFTIVPWLIGLGWMAHHWFGV